MKITAIVMLDSDLAIGKDGKMLYNIPEEMKYFKNTTSGHTVIMGRNTYDSLYIKPLPNRTNIVITHNNINGVHCVDSIEKALSLVPKEETEAFIIGGESIYKQALPYINKMSVTVVSDAIKIQKEQGQYAYFPDIDFSNWKLISKTDYNNYIIKIYEKHE